MYNTTTLKKFYQISKYNIVDMDGIDEIRKRTRKIKGINI